MKIKKLLGYLLLILLIVGISAFMILSSSITVFLYTVAATVIVLGLVYLIAYLLND